VGDGNLILTTAAEDQKVISRCNTCKGSIIDNGLMSKVLYHGAVPHPQRLLPNCVASDVVPALALVEINDLAGKIQQGILPAVASRNVGAMNSGKSTWQGQSVQFGNNKAIVNKKLVVVGAVAYVALV